jgi:hypothetical protein
MVGYLGDSDSCGGVDHGRAGGLQTTSETAQVSVVPTSPNRDIKERANCVFALNRVFALLKDDRSSMRMMARVVYKCGVNLTQTRIVHESQDIFFEINYTLLPSGRF